MPWYIRRWMEGGFVVTQHDHKVLYYKMTRYFVADRLFNLIKDKQVKLLQSH